MKLTQVVTKSNRKFRPFIIRSRDLWITSCHVTALERCHKLGLLPSEDSHPYLLHSNETHTNYIVLLTNRYKRVDIIIDLHFPHTNVNITFCLLQQDAIPSSLSTLHRFIIMTAGFGECLTTRGLFLSC